MKKSLQAGVLACCLTLFSATPFCFAQTGDISLSINNGNIKDVLAAVSNISGRSIVTDDSVKGQVSIDLHDVSFDTAMDIITRAKGLAYKDIDGVIVVSTRENFVKNVGDVEIYKLNYAKAEDVQKSLTGLMEGGKIAIDAVTNSILFSGSTADGAKVRNAIKKLDVATQQVTLEAKIISINREDAKSLGINWTWNNIPQNTNDIENESDYQGYVNFGYNYQFRFNATLNALFTNGKAKILATPRLITIPGKEASIFIGDHIPVTTDKVSSGTTTTSTEYVDAGIKLTYTPIVSDDGMITSIVHTEVSTPTLVSELKNYKITSRTVDTNVRMHDGQTLVIGGLINEEEQHTIQKIPFLSNIPILGELFKNRIHNKTKTEVMMILTPHLTVAGESPAIYDATATNLQNEFKDFDDKNFMKDVKKSEKGQAEAKLREQQKQIQKELNEVQGEYAQADKKAGTTTTAADTTSNVHSMRNRVNAIMKGN